jgi:hypothetical protein
MVQIFHLTPYLKALEVQKVHTPQYNHIEITVWFDCCKVEPFFKNHLLRLRKGMFQESDLCQG